MSSRNPKFLFLLKNAPNQPGNDYCYSNAKGKAGLTNSATFVAHVLEKLGYEAPVDTCIDGNSIDNRLHKHRPDICIIEAIWVTPEKFKELVRLHKKVIFIVRVHSRTPFLTNEGIAIEWIKKYQNIPNLYVSFNHKDTNDEYKAIGIKALYLPNIYELRPEKMNTSKNSTKCFLHVFCNKKSNKKIVDIGCFGAIRPMKNQLLQALAAIRYGEEHNKIIRFHINASRVEQKGESTLKNIRALFENTRHELIEHGWMNHEEFSCLVDKMDVGLQVSLTESFNIVAADFVVNRVPIIVSEEIDWLPKTAKTCTADSKILANKIAEAVEKPFNFVNKNYRALVNYIDNAIFIWTKMIHDYNKGKL